MPVIPNLHDTRFAQSLDLRSLVLHSTTKLSQHLPNLAQRAAISRDALSSLLKRATAPLTRRQQTSHQGFIPASYKGINDGPAPGVVVGIVLGSIAGFLLLVWLFSSLFNAGSGGNAISGQEDVIVRRRDRSPRSRHSRHSRRSQREVREVSRSPRRERIIVEERRGSMPPPRARSIIVEERVERRVDGDDIVEVIEEHSDIEPRRAKRGSRRNSGGYRY